MLNRLKLPPVPVQALVRTGNEESLPRILAAEHEQESLVETWLAPARSRIHLQL